MSFNVQTKSGKFQQRHYKEIARVLHEVWKKTHTTPDGPAERSGHEWEIIYDLVYVPLVLMFEEDNERFSAEKFSYAVATGEGL